MRGAGIAVGMTTLACRIRDLSAAEAQHILTTFAKNQPGYENYTLSPELTEALYRDSELAATVASEVDLARATLLLLVDDPQHRPIIDAMMSNRPAQQFGLVETATVMSAVLFVLGTHITLERDKSGQWRFKVEKKPNDIALLKLLMQKLLGFAQKNS